VTRKEALKLIPLPRWYGEDAQRGWLLDSLVALGVISLNEPVSTSGEIGLSAEGHDYKTDPGL
jgi:hypothetical protein